MLQRNLTPHLRAVGSAADVVSLWEMVASLHHFVFSQKSWELSDVQKMYVVDKDESPTKVFEPLLLSII